MVRRFLERQPLFATDKGHIHHRLLAMGLNHKRSVLVLYGFAVFLVVVASLLHFGGRWQIGVALVIVLVTLAVFARVVGVADYVSRRRASRMGIRTKHAEALRKHCFEAQRRADEIDSTEGLQAFLAWLLLVADMKFVEVCADGEEPVLTVENAAYQLQEREPLVTATIPLFDGSGKECGLWKFGWHSERGRVTTVTETLLQVIADRAFYELPDAKVPVRAVDG
jgi:UDP-GlcNAc:undecaprenyl-phosphate GlcNAc-1-phosphate transferase